MTIDWRQILPVVASILIIISVAIARQSSKALAPILATMPINIPLAMWIMSSGGDQANMEQFVHDLIINILPTMVFLALAWLAARAGWGLTPLLLVSYAGWAVSLGAILLLRRALGL